MIKCLRLFVLCLIGLFFAVPFPVTADTPEPQRAAKGTHQLAVVLTKMGAFRCVERANQIAHFLGGSGGEVLLVDLPGRTPASDLIHATMLVPIEKDTLSSVEITLAPSISGCQASYEATIHSPARCSEAIKQQYPKQEFTEIEKTGVLIASLGKHSRVTARPANSGCLLLKHELIH